MIQTMNTCTVSDCYWPALQYISSDASGQSLMPSHFWVKMRHVPFSPGHW